MKEKILAKKVNSLLEYKSSEYKKKYYILSRLCETNIKVNRTKFEEFVCLVKSLNNSNGKYPSYDCLYEFSSIAAETSSAKYKKGLIDEIKQDLNLRFSIYNNNYETLIKEELDNVYYENKKLNSKLEDTILESVKRNVNIFESLKGSKSKTTDLANLFNGDEPSLEQLSSIEAEEDFVENDIEEDNTIVVTQNQIDNTTSKIIDIFGPVSGGDPAKISKAKLADMLGFKGQAKYIPGQKTPVLKAWDNLEMSILRQISPYGRSQGMSTIAQRKFWIIESIKLCLMLEKQANYFLGLSDQEKTRLSLSAEEIVKVGKVVSEMRPRGRNLSDSEIRGITQSLQSLLLKGSFDLESQIIKESELISILRKASYSKGGSIEQLKSELDFMYPLHDTRSDFEKVPIQSDEERQATQDEVEEYFNKKDQESLDLYGKEIDPVTGESLYADESEIQRINRQKSEKEKSIKKQEIIQNMTKSNYFNMTSREAVQYLKDLDEDLVRLGELHSKTMDTSNPEIFSELQKDAKGNILPDINVIPDVISAEGLSVEEIEEMEKLIEKLAAVDIVKMINDCEREQIYQELVDKSVTVDEFISYNKRFGLDNADKPMSWEDIKRASAGEFTGSAGARQYGVKAWIKSVFFNYSPSDKAEIYSFMAEKWYDRLKALDLIDDQSFAIKSDKTNPNDASKDKAIPRKALDAAEATGKYRRSSKLVDISDMLEIVSKYTSPRYVKRYFDEKREDSLPQAVSEKLYQIQTFAETSEEYAMLVKRLEEEDPDTMAFAVMESMFNDKSGFRYYATGLTKEYYNNVVWPQTEIVLAQSVKEYFKKYHPTAGIAKSLGSNEGADAVKPEEGKDLFNKLIYVAMERTGIKTSGKGMPNVGDSVEERKEYLRGNLDSRGNFEKAVAAYNAKYHEGNNPLVGKNGGVFNNNDVEDIIDDMFSASGIIGKASVRLKRLNTTSAAEIIAWVGSYPEAKLDQAIVLGMGLSDFYRRENVDEMLTLPIEEIGKDTAKALKDYKKKYGKSQLLSSDFVEWLDDYLGLEAIDLNSKPSKNPAGKNFQ
jgi:hypothetical protein